MGLIDNYAIWVHAKFFLEEIREKVKRLKRVIRGKHKMKGRSLIEDYRNKMKLSEKKMKKSKTKKFNINKQQIHYVQNLLTIILIYEYSFPHLIHNPGFYSVSQLPPRL